MENLSGTHMQITYSVDSKSLKLLTTLGKYYISLRINAKYTVHQILSQYCTNELNFLSFKKPVIFFLKLFHEVTVDLLLSI